MTPRFLEANTEVKAKKPSAVKLDKGLLIC